MSCWAVSYDDLRVFKSNYKPFLTKMYQTLFDGTFQSWYRPFNVKPIMYLLRRFGDLFISITNTMIEFWIIINKHVTVLIWFKMSKRGYRSIQIPIFVIRLSWIHHSVDYALRKIYELRLCLISSIVARITCFVIFSNFILCKNYVRSFRLWVYTYAWKQYCYETESSIDNGMFEYTRTIYIVSV